MVFRPIASLRGAATGIALGASLAIAVVIGASGSTGLVQSGFDRALMTTRDTPTLADYPGKPAKIAFAQSEDFWLRGGHARSAEVKPVAWTAQLARGDRLTISQSGSTPRILEVVETAPVAIETTRLDAGTPGAQLIAVSCRDISQPDSPLLRLIVSDGALPFAVTRAGEKAL